MLLSYTAFIFSFSFFLNTGIGSSPSFVYFSSFDYFSLSAFSLPDSLAGEVFLSGDFSLP